jgi:hypothetical protein
MGYIGPGDELLRSSGGFMEKDELERLGNTLKKDTRASTHGYAGAKRNDALADVTWPMGFRGYAEDTFLVSPLSFDGGPAMRSSHSHGPKVVDLIVHPIWRSVNRRNFQCMIEK